MPALPRSSRFSSCCRTRRSAGLALPELAVEPVDVGTGTAKFDLTLALLARGEQLAGGLEYNRDLFDAATAARFAGQLSTLLRGVAEEPERRVSELPLLSAPERQAVLLEWNSAPGVTTDPAADLTGPILARARDDEGDRAAVSCHGEVLTYGELVRRAHRLARHLVGMGVGTDTILGLCLDRSLDMAVAVLAALAAGIAYLPLDPAYPPERLALMLDDCAPPVLLTQAALLPGLAPLLASRPAPPRVLCLDAERAAWTAESAAPLPPRAQPENLVYLVYTSGSTGRPKGIAMMRQALANLLAWQEGSTSLGAPARTLQFALLSFDVSFQEFVSTWRTGRHRRPPRRGDPPRRRGPPRPPRPRADRAPVPALHRAAPARRGRPGGEALPPPRARPGRRRSPRASSSR